MNWSKRERLFSQLEEALLPDSFSPKINPLVVRVLHGQGGMGKSELALKFAHEYQNAFSLVWSFDYSSTGNLRDSYLDLAEELKIVVAEGERLERLRKLVNRKLENSHGIPWLIVFDNVENKLMAGHDLPSQGGHVIITTQDKLVWDSEKDSLIPVDTFSLEEATALIAEVTGKEPSQEMRDLADAWGLFPFAIHQVARYIKESEMTIKEYRKENPYPLKGATSPQEKYKKAFNTVWLPALEKLKDQCPLALEWLELSGYLAPRNIPEELLEPWLGEKKGEAIAPHVIRRHLLKFDLAKYDSESKTYSLHPLFQAFLRERGRRTEKLEALVELFDKVWKFNEVDQETWPEAKRFAPHLQSVCLYVGEGEFVEKVSRFFKELGDYFSEIEVNLSLATGCHEKALAMREKHLGKKDPKWAESINHLGRAYQSQGKFLEATAYFHQFDTFTRAHYGEYSPQFGASQNNLGLIYRHRKETHKAISYFKTAVILTNNNRNKAELLNNMGLACQDLGDSTIAIKCYIESLQFWKKAFGDEHPLTATVLNNLGTAYQEDKNEIDALECYLKAFEVSKKNFGEMHPLIALSKQNLGHLYCSQGKFDLALKYSLEALEIREKIYGTDHLFVANSLNSIGDIYLKKNFFNLAIDYYKKALLIETKYSGGQSKGVATILNNLGMVSYAEEKLESAISYFNQALQIFEKIDLVLGRDLIETLVALGHVYLKQKNFPEALKSYKSALAFSKMTKGENDPETSKLAKWVAKIETEYLKFALHSSLMISLTNSLGWRS